MHLCGTIAVPRSEMFSHDLFHHVPLACFKLKAKTRGDGRNPCHMLSFPRSNAGFKLHGRLGRAVESISSSRQLSLTDHFVLVVECSMSFPNMKATGALIPLSRVAAKSGG